ncbi:hypothetical protein NDU88_006650 [Pleurodeles waltl]|uniref:Uncharacterized protein n=1 Tax=Pleurodeles waltl TaxID=8319 RepID=A0AAV7TXT7_PLEWA|nr:hypothetical protein NDU88_006650 [Pleurodeles waltl]
MVYCASKAEYSGIHKRKSGISGRDNHSCKFAGVEEQEAETQHEADRTQKEPVWECVPLDTETYRGGDSEPWKGGTKDLVVIVEPSSALSYEDTGYHCRY